MNQGIEDRLRHLFTSDADRARVGDDALGGLRTGALAKAHRHRRRQVAWGAGLAAAAVAAVAASVVGVGVLGAGRTSTPPVEAAPTRPPAVSAPAADLDTYSRNDSAFFDALRSRGDAVSVTAPPASLRALRDRSTLVITASVVGVQSAGVQSAGVQSDGVQGSTPVVLVSLEPVAVLHGALRAPTEVVTVPFLGLGDAPVDALHAKLPKGVSVWFLRSQGSPSADRKPGAPVESAGAPTDRYVLTHAFSVLTQGSAHVDVPLAEADVPDSGFVGEARRLASLSAAAATIGQS